ncbi:DUF4911 domain-containing protein [Oceanivirga salmonicida]|uniref:DUF4911 domain-containing protein n=1 Tax=Oceanivirga salmonicida TaxID=1769291 RepID=UPI00082D372E|nr:DUF4911 domain-containing protein [Oceanivirga salmonicida]
MIDYEYILKIGRKDIDIINKITEAYEGIGNVRTIDSHKALIKILTNSYFLDDIDNMLEKIRQTLNVDIEVISKEVWQGEI